jgi:hypothetical protein
MEIVTNYTNSRHPVEPIDISNDSIHTPLFYWIEKLLMEKIASREFLHAISNPGDLVNKLRNFMFFMHFNWVICS